MLYIYCICGVFFNRYKNNFHFLLVQSVWLEVGGIRSHGICAKRCNCDGGGGRGEGRGVRRCGTRSKGVGRRAARLTTGVCAGVVGSHDRDVGTKRDL